MHKTFKTEAKFQVFMQIGKTLGLFSQFHDLRKYLNKKLCQRC